MGGPAPTGAQPPDQAPTLQSPGLALSLHNLQERIELRDSKFPNTSHLFPCSSGSITAHLLVPGSRFPKARHCSGQHRHGCTG